MSKRTKRAGTRALLALRLGVVLLVVAGVSWARAQSPADTKPAGNTEPQPERANVVIFLIDALRADRLGVYGYDRRPTSPRIDALAREAVVFEQAYAPAPWTLPTLVSLMTSTFPCEHRTVHDRSRLSDSLVPLAERLKRLNYTTLGLFASPYAGPDYGMHRGYDQLKPSRRNDGEKVRRLLDRHSATPFFLYIHNTEPRTPHRFAPIHTDGFRDVASATRLEIRKHYRASRQLTRVDFTQKRRRGTTDNTAEQDKQMAALNAMLDDYNELYDASVRLADAYIGSVIETLKQRGVWDKTLFILLSDHGEEMNEHGGWFHDQSVYEELMHVPLIIHFPGGRYGGQRVESVVSLVDVLPTILDCVRAPDLARDARGRSLMPLVRDGQSAEADDFVVPGMRINRRKYYRPWKESRGDLNIVVRRGEWKGIWNVEPDRLELYNLTSDPREQHDVSAANPELALAMQVFARLWYQECRKNATEAPARSAKPDE
ncbi:MAG: sulfatase [Phycisphaerae bacterium]